MKLLTKSLSKKWTLLTLISVFIFSSCQKQIDQPQKQEEIASVANSNSQHGHLQQTNTYPSDVALKWMDMQLRLMRTATGIPNNAFTRPYAYSGITLYESVVPGMPAYQSLASQLNNLSGLPETEPGFAYHWPCSANAALAYINKQMFPNTSAANKTSIDSLENALNASYLSTENMYKVARSDIFGNNTTFTDYSINSLGFTPRTFTTFSDCANEIGLSRLYGGIHARTSNFVGLRQGNLVGMHVSALRFEKK